MKSLERTVASPASRLAADSLGETRMLERESCNQHTPRLQMQVPKHTNNNSDSTAILTVRVTVFAPPTGFRYPDQDAIATFSPAPAPLILILR